MLLLFDITWDFLSGFVFQIGELARQNVPTTIRLSDCKLVMHAAMKTHINIWCVVRHNFDKVLY